MEDGWMQTETSKRRLLCERRLATGRFPVHRIRYYTVPLKVFDCYLFLRDAIFLFYYFSIILRSFVSCLFSLIQPTPQSLLLC